MKKQTFTYECIPEFKMIKLYIRVGDGKDM